MTAAQAIEHPPPKRPTTGLIAVLTLLAIPALVDASAVREAAALYELGRGASPYWQPAHALLLYGRAPLVAVSATVLFLAPGLLLSAGTRLGRSLGTWILSGFVFSLCLVSVVTALVQGVSGRAVTDGLFATVVVLCSVVGAIALFARSRRSPRDPGAGDMARWAHSGVAMLVPALLLVAALAPKFFWESFNGDGAHAFESTRLLLSQPLPFWPGDAGPVAGFPGMTSFLFTYPGSWYVRLFGPIEASVRLSLVLYLVLLVAVIGEFVRQGFADRRAPHAAIWCTLGGYVLAMAFSATYNPYSADLALPATQDTLLIVCFLAFALAFLRAERGWLACWAVLCYLSLPSGAILLAMWLVAAAMTMRPVPWPMIRLTAATLLGTVLAGAAATRVLPLLGLPSAGNEYGIVGILRYFAFLQITDWHRLVYVAAPAGVLPILATLAWRKQDDTSRALTLVSWAYFAFFFVQANVSLHHFVPTLILPLVVFWRMMPSDGRRFIRVAALPSAALGVVLAMPSSWAPHLGGRDIGATVVEQVGGYRESSASEFRASSLLGALFPPDWDPAVPESYGGSPLVWNHYARHGGSPDGDTNYLLASVGAPVPDGWLSLSRDDGAALFVRDSSTLGLHRAFLPRTDVGAPLLRVPRWVLFRSVAAEGGPPVLDVVLMLEGAGFNLDPLLRRLGVHR